MDIAFFMGIDAGTFTTLSFLPQVIKTHRTKHTKDISLGMLVLLAFGISLWTVYGVLIKEMPIILANALTLVLVTYILVMKTRHG